jgi:hypothetical protein
MDVPDYVPWPLGTEVFRLLKVAGKRYVYSAPPDLHERCLGCPVSA